MRTAVALVTLALTGCHAARGPSTEPRESFDPPPRSPPSLSEKAVRDLFYYRGVLDLGERHVADEFLADPAGAGERAHARCVVWRMTVGEVRRGQHGGACLYDASRGEAVTFAALEDRGQAEGLNPGDVVRLEGQFHRFDARAGKLYMAYCRLLEVTRGGAREDDGGAAPQ